VGGVQTDDPQPGDMATDPTDVTEPAEVGGADVRRLEDLEAELAELDAALAALDAAVEVGRADGGSSH
jgi:hypothetical protein